MTDRIRLDGRVAVVTGAAGVIGSATIRLLAERGARIVAVDRKQADLEAAINDLPASAEAIAISADVTEEDGVKDYVRAAVERFGTIDAFYNNAGVEGEVKPIQDYPLDAFRKVLDVNVVGVFLGMKYVLPRMRNGGSVVNMSSALGVVGGAGIVAYVASKHAIIGMSKTAALEQGARGIRVNACAPGPIAGRMTFKLADEVFAGTSKTFAETVPLGRHGTPEDVAGMVAFLLSDDSGYATGTTHSVDGGFTAA